MTRGDVRGLAQGLCVGVAAVVLPLNFMETLTFGLAMILALHLGNWAVE